MNLGLARNMVPCAAAEHNILLTHESLRDGFGLRSARVPDLHVKDYGRHPRILGEYRLDGSIGVNAPVPIRLSIDSDRGERWRNGARAHHVVETDALCVVVKIAYPPASDANKPQRNPWFPAIDEVEINELRQELFERIEAIVSSLLNPDFRLYSPCQRGIETIETRHASQQRLESA